MPSAISMGVTVEAPRSRLHITSTNSSEWTNLDAVRWSRISSG